MLVRNDIKSLVLLVLVITVDFEVYVFGIMHDHKGYFCS